MPQTDTAHVIVEDIEATTWITLHRPQKRNALTLPMIQAVTRAVSELAASCSAVVLNGVGPSFCSGGDLVTYAKSDLGTFLSYTHQANAMCRAIAEAPVPIIAAVHGPVLGGGFELALACDLVVATQGATFGLPEIELGLLPGWGGTQRLTRLIGRNLTSSVILAGRRIDAREAEALGIVHRVCNDAELRNEAATIAGLFRDGPATAVAAAKRAIRAADALELGFALEQAELGKLFATTDAHEEIAAFVAKRPRRFRKLAP
ncbi:enoyl-CoA hydratase/isomerase family protein [Kribbella swartbergensis]